MAKRKKSSVTSRKAGTSRRTTAGSRSRRNVSSVDHGRFILPLVIGVALLAGIGFFGLMGYRTAIASEFFGVRNVDIRGTERTSTEDIKRIVEANTEKSGVWRADLSEIRTRVESLPFVKSASVSMVLPTGIRVKIEERVPAAIVRLNTGDFVVESDGNRIAPATKLDSDHLMVMKGWDETKTEKAVTDNISRLKTYKKMLDEWQSFGLIQRVREVNLADLRDPNATIEDSGRPIAVTLAKDNFGKSLKAAIEAVAGKGEKVKAVNSGGVFPVLEYLGN